MRSEVSATTRFIATSLMRLWYCRCSFVSDAASRHRAKPRIRDPSRTKGSPGLDRSCDAIERRRTPSPSAFGCASNSGLAIFSRTDSDIGPDVGLHGCVSLVQSGSDPFRVRMRVSEGARTQYKAARKGFPFWRQTRSSGDNWTTGPVRRQVVLTNCSSIRPEARASLHVSLERNAASRP